MTPHQMTKKLIDSGISQSELARRIKATGVECSQATIWRLLNTDNIPSWNLGCAIEHIYNKTDLRKKGK